MSKLNAEWIPHMKVYRLYNPYYPQQTVAYEEDKDVAEARALEEGYSGLAIRCAEGAIVSAEQERASV